MSILDGSIVKFEGKYVTGLFLVLRDGPGYSGRCIFPLAATYKKNGEVCNRIFHLQDGDEKKMEVLGVADCEVLLIALEAALGKD